MARDIKEIKKFVRSLEGLSEASRNTMVREYLAGRDYSDALIDARNIGIEREKARREQGVK